MKLHIYRMFQCCAIIGALLTTTHAFAGPRTQFTVDTTTLAGTSAQLAFDLIDGGTPSNSVTLSDFATNAILGTATQTGDVLGNLPDTITLGDTSFFNEYLQNVVLGTYITFSIADTGHDPTGNAFHDGLSFFLLDPTSGQSLVNTTDPTGANALFLRAIGTPGQQEIYSGAGFDVATSAVPEPTSTAMVLSGLLVLGTVLRMQRITSKMGILS